MLQYLLASLAALAVTVVPARPDGAIVTRLIPYECGVILVELDTDGAPANGPERIEAYRAGDLEHPLAVVLFGAGDAGTFIEAYVIVAGKAVRYDSPVAFGRAYPSPCALISAEA